MKKYSIYAGDYYAAGYNFGLHLGRTSLKQLVSFGTSCLYEPLDDENDTNKGFGFTYSIFNDKNSLRWGWRPNASDDNIIQVCIYVHQDGEIIRSSYIDVLASMPYKFHLYMVDSEAWLEVKADDFIDTVSLKGLKLKPSFGYKNFPYFGGNAPAPNNMYIYAKEL